MKKRLTWLPVAAATIGITVSAQQRQASIVGGGGPNYGKCTIEVVVDDVAQVEIRGSSANLRTMSGQPAQWRRFECSGPVPGNFPDFRFEGVDGRGSQDLIRDPRNGGAVVQIVDKDGGSEGYTFDIFWGSGGNWQPRNPGRRGAGRPDDPWYDSGSYRPGYRDSDYFRRYGHGFGTQDAVRTCQLEIMSRAQRRFRGGSVHLGRTRLDDAPGRNDWVMGFLDVHRRNVSERFRFSCSVNFNTGQVKSADIDQLPDMR
jgi:hypothetical protein